MTNSNRSADEALEECIALEALRLHTAPGKAERKQAFAEMQRLHRLRGKRVIAEMEKEQGLKR